MVAIVGSVIPSCGDGEEFRMMIMVYPDSYYRCKFEKNLREFYIRIDGEYQKFGRMCPNFCFLWAQECAHKKRSIT